MIMKSARETAVVVLDRYGFKDGDVGGLLDEMISESEDKGVLRDLVMGVVRNKFAIDNIVEVVCRVDSKRMNKRVANIVRVGVYELVYTSQPAEYAVLNEAVNLAHRRSSKKSANFVNAILRNVQRAIENNNIDKAGDHRKDLPVEAGRFCRFGVEILPDPKGNPVGYICKGFSVPGWLGDKWIKQFGFDRTVRVCLGSNRRPGVYVWANTLAVGVEELARRFGEDGVESEITPDGKGLKISGGVAVNRLAGFAEGLFTVGDMTAVKVGMNVDLAQDVVIVDMCSAPGGKTAMLAQKYPEARIIATDASAERLKKVHEMCRRLRLGNVEVVKFNHLENELKRAGKVDAVLVDVPCSNTGVMARRVEVRHRLRASSILELNNLQREILERAASMNPDKIIYSTCSIELEENQDMVEMFVREFGRYKLLKQELTLPAAGKFDHDGGYFGILSLK